MTPPPWWVCRRHRRWGAAGWRRWDLVLLVRCAVCRAAYVANANRQFDRNYRLMVRVGRADPETAYVEAEAIRRYAFALAGLDGKGRP